MSQHSKELPTTRTGLFASPASRKKKRIHWESVSPLFNESLVRPTEGLVTLLSCARIDQYIALDSVFKSFAHG